MGIHAFLHSSDMWWLSTWAGHWAYCGGQSINGPWSQSIQCLKPDDDWAEVHCFSEVPKFISEDPSYYRDYSPL